MTIYAVGDIQGCLSCLEQLLERAGFNPKTDQLWAVGGLVNRGPSSLDTLGLCKGLGARFRTNLCNQDLHLHAVAQGAKAHNNKYTLQNFLSAPERHDLLEWL